MSCSWLKMYAMSIPAVHLAIPDGQYNPRRYSHLAYPLRERGMPAVPLSGKSPCERRELIHAAVDWLDVERSPRYRARNDLTFCNIYAYDLAYCLGCYLPRVWWSEEAVRLLLQGAVVEAVYGETVFEQNCHALYDWFDRYGHHYNWRSCTAPEEMQAHANQGRLVMIVAKPAAPGGHGHITAVVPGDGSGDLPVQTQAGRRNIRRFTGRWWESPGLYSTCGAWVCMS